MKEWERTALILGGTTLCAWLLHRARQKLSRFDFANKAILVTGGSRGLGLVLARELTRQGARVAICARDEKELNRAADDLAHHGRAPLSYPCDVSQADQVQRAVELAEKALGQIDVLINNAGIICVGPVQTMTRSDYEQALAINFWGAYHAIEAVLPGMRQRRQGRIVNISSFGGKVSVPHLLPYCVSKFALTGYSQGLRTELAQDGIVVTTVCPGLMRTGSPRNALFKGNNEMEYAWFSIGDSLPLASMSAEEAAQQILQACQQGLAEVVLTLPAQVATLCQALLPEWTADLLALVNQVLPGPGKQDSQAVPGNESESFLSPSLLTTLTDRAARQNNEVSPATR